MYGIPGTRNIHKSNNGFTIVRTIKGTPRYLGRGETLIIALMKRDWCAANNWQPYPIKRYCIRKTPYGTYNLTKKKRINGTSRSIYSANFSTYEEAEKEAKLMEKYDWDLELACNDPDEISKDGEQWLDGIKLTTTFEKHNKRNDYFLAKRGGIL